MSTGPGKYDDLCTYVREKSGGVGALLIVVDGSKGSGFSVQGSLAMLMTLPSALRELADSIEADFLLGIDPRKDGPL